MFEDRQSFDPRYDSKVPLKHTAFYLVVRSVFLFFGLVFSKQPSDFWTWVKSMYYRKEPLAYPIPWLTFDAIRELNKHVGPGVEVFEYGAGHSTLYWAKRGARVYSVEHDKVWYDLLMEKIKGNSESLNITLFYEVNKDGYVTAIKHATPSQFDMILVDGAYRRECILEAIPHLKPGGYLVVDNTDWHWFRENPLQGIPSFWEKKVFSGYVPMAGHKSETTLWRKPSVLSDEVI